MQRRARGGTQSESSTKRRTNEALGKPPEIGHTAHKSVSWHHPRTRSSTHGYPLSGGRPKAASVRLYFYKLQTPEYMHFVLRNRLEAMLHPLPSHIYSLVFDSCLSPQLHHGPPLAGLNISLSLYIYICIYLYEDITFILRNKKSLCY